MAFNQSAMNGGHVGANNERSIIGVIGTLGTADTGGTSSVLPFAVDPLTGAMYVNDLSGATGTVNSKILNGTLTNLVSGTINALAAGTITAGTLTNLVSGTINALAAGTITAGTLTNLVSGTINALAAGTITGGTLGNLNAGTVQLNPVPVPATLLFGTLGTAGGSFFGTISAPAGAGTKHYVSGLSVVVQSGTPDVRILAGSSIQGTGVLTAGFFPPSGGIARDFNPAFATGTNSELIYHFVGAGTAFIIVNYWKGV